MGSREKTCFYKTVLGMGAVVGFSFEFTIIP